MKDKLDYLRRLLFAALLCPMAIAFWVGFGLSGFNLDAFMVFLAEAGQYYTVLDAEAQAFFRLEVYAVWAVLTFGALVMTFVVNPPRFDYVLRKKGDRWETRIIEP